MNKLQKGTNDAAIKGIRIFFRLKKENKANKGKIIRHIKNLLEHDQEHENYHKPVRVGNFWSNNYIKYKSNGDRSKTLSVEEYLKIKQNKTILKRYLKNSINNSS